MSLIQDLVSLGFDEKRAKVYLTLLELGTAKAQDISKKALLERPTTYDILSKLSKDGLVSSYEKRGVRYYVASQPEKIKQRFRELEQKTEKVLPELQLLYSASESKPRIRFFEGIEGIKTVLEDTLLASNKLLRGILSMTDLYRVPGKQFMDVYVKQRIEQKFSVQVIRSKQREVKKEDWPTSNEQLRVLRYAPSEMNFDMTTYLYDQKIGLISTEKENFGIIIESAEFSRTMNNLFDALWQISSPA